MNWHMISRSGDYYFWVRSTKSNGSYVYQVSKGLEPPKGDAGYFSLVDVYGFKNIDLPPSEWNSILSYVKTIFKEEQ